MAQAQSPHEAQADVENVGESNSASTSPRLKRKRPSTIGKEDRKKVSRACDACKEKKVRCAGTQPCPRCHKHSISCTYNKAHKRGRPSTPEPGVVAEEQPAASVRFSAVPGPHFQDQRTNSSTRNDAHMGPNASHDLRRSTRSSQEADGQRFEGDYIGPTSGIAFLHRAQKRFQQDYAAITSGTSEVQGSKKVSVYSFGDGWIPDYSQLKLVLPSRVAANALLDRYFNFAMPTYRFLHRTTVEVWLDEIYARSMEQSSLSSSKKAIVMLIMATASLYHENATDPIPDDSNKQSKESGMFFAEAERLIQHETGPVRIESVQARLAQCIHLLASSRINQAWYTFGTATQMISALGLHRKSNANSAADGADVQSRKRVFWSAYTLDRYLSVILGRPRIFRDEDIDQSLSEIPGNPVSFGSSVSESVSEGPVFHARLAKILGGISSDLYPASRIMDSDWADSAARWTTQLKEWKDSLPPFLNPAKVDPSMLVPIFQRQSTVLRLAYAHAMILANRPILLSSFADLRRSQAIISEEPTGGLKDCIDAAMEVVVTVNLLIQAEQMRKAFWFTHYISFCAISALYVYTIQRCNAQENSNQISPGNATPDTRYFDAAAKCQERIENTTTATSPFKRYNIILDELKKEVLYHLRSAEAPSVEKPQQDWQPLVSTASSFPRVMDSSGGTPSSTPTNITQQQSNQNLNSNAPSNSQINQEPPSQSHNSNIHNMSSNFDLTALSSLDDTILLDLGPFGHQGELMGWSEFDSCAINWSEGLDSFDTVL